MWQTMINGLTFHPNFAREVRAGWPAGCERPQPAQLRVDSIVTVLGAPLVLLVSAPLELGGALARRGGELAARGAAALSSGSAGRQGAGALDPPPRNV